VLELGSQKKPIGKIGARLTKKNAAVGDTYAKECKGAQRGRHREGEKGSLSSIDLRGET